MIEKERVKKNYVRSTYYKNTYDHPEIANTFNFKAYRILFVEAGMNLFPFLFVYLGHFHRNRWMTHDLALKNQTSDYLFKS